LSSSYGMEARERVAVERAIGQKARAVAAKRERLRDIFIACFCGSVLEREKRNGDQLEGKQRQTTMVIVGCWGCRIVSTWRAREGVLVRQENAMDTFSSCDMSLLSLTLVKAQAVLSFVHSLSNTHLTKGSSRLFFTASFLHLCSLCRRNERKHAFFLCPS